jgi:hypothetical protein
MGDSPGYRKGIIRDFSNNSKNVWKKGFLSDFWYDKGGNEKVNADHL